jgi:uncharacterized membrane protein
MSEFIERQLLDSPDTVLHWYDFLCPFCYVGQQRNAILVRHGLHVIELPFQAHPDIPPGGISAGPRSGSMYAMLEREAQQAGLPLQWPEHLRNTRVALSAAEWTRRRQPGAFPQLYKDLFRAHFVLGEDLEDPAVVDRHAVESGVELTPLHAGLADGSAAVMVTEAETIGRANGVQGTPALIRTDRRQLMQRTSLVPQDENTIEGRITIERPVGRVFEFYRDFSNLPSFLGDVMAIAQVGPTISRWTIQGPLGIRINWKIKVTEERTNELIRYETVTSPGLRTYWEIYFATGSQVGETEVREVMKAPFGRLGRAALALIGKFPAEEVTANLHRLKEVMETGKVTDTSYSVAGKFSQRPNQHESTK